MEADFSNFDSSISTTTTTTTNMSPEMSAGLGVFFGGMLIVMLIIFLAVYVYMAICLMKIAKKTNTENAWFAWVPILNVILMLRLGKQSSWWALILLAYIIPFVNILASIGFMVIMVIAWMKIAERLGKPNWLGILMIVPIANLVVPGYLAFSGAEIPSSEQPSTQVPPMNPVQ